MNIYLIRHGQTDGKEETIDELYTRISSFLNELKEKDYRDVLIVAHSGVAKAFYMYFEGVPEYVKMKEILKFKIYLMNVQKCIKKI